MTAPTRSRGAALATVLAILFLTFLDTTIVSVTLGDIQEKFGAGVIALQWVVNAYALVFASLMLIAGSLSDRYGRKTVMIVGIAIFLAGSVLCALAPNVGVLIGGRAVMGVGAAASEPGTLSVIRHLYPDRVTRARALGAWAAVSGLALALGPVFGGLLIGWEDWRAIFWFNLALSVVLLVAAARYIPNSSDPQPGRLDVRGFALAGLVLGGSTFAVILGEQHGYSTNWIVALFAVAGAALICFVWVENREVSPMLDLRYVRRPDIASALFMAFAVYFGVFSIFFFTALYMAEVVGYSGEKLSGEFAPMAAAIMIGAVLAGRWVGRSGYRGAMITGALIAAAGIMLTRSVITVTPSFGAVALSLTVAGFGIGIAVVPVTSSVLGHVPAEHSGMAASATNTARQLGSVVGVAALGALVNSHLTSDLSNRLHEIGINGTAQGLIIQAVETGGGGSQNFDIAHPPALFAPIVNAATAAFRSGLHQSLLVSAILITASAVIASLVRQDVPATVTELTPASAETG
jgi:EmrB/QacA subfamily drug resistance transporter